MAKRARNEHLNITIIEGYEGDYFFEQRFLKKLISFRRNSKRTFR